VAEQTEFWWCSVGGNPAEPLIVKLNEDKRLGYTCGCPDPFDLDAPETPVFLMRKIFIPPGEFEPRTAEQKAEAERRWDRQVASGKRHGYAGLTRAPQ